MMRAAGGLLVGGLAVVLVACGSCGGGGSNGNGSSGGGDDGGGAEAAVEAGPSSTQACTDFAAALCGRLEACTPAALQIAYGDVGTCTTRSAILCSAGLAAPGTQATPAQMEACAAAVAAETCDESLDNPQPSACDIPGAVANGSVCGSHSQCQSGYCKPTMGTLCGTCAGHAGASAQCTADIDCQATLICNNGSCVGPAAAGATCGTTAPCMRTLACLNGKCAAPGGAGASCTASTDCDGARGFYCNTQTKQCTQTQFVSSGQPCGIVSNNIAVCTASETCVNIVNAAGTCHQVAADGAPCGPGIGCLPPALCSATARCTVPNPSVCH